MTFKKRQKTFQKVSFGSFGQSLSKAGISKQVEASIGVNTALEVLQEKFGEGVEVHAKPKFIKNRTLAIEVAHPAVAEQITEQEQDIIAEVNRRLGRAEVVSMQFLMDKNVQDDYS